MTIWAILNVCNAIKLCFTNMIYQYINTFVTQYSIIKQKNKKLAVFVFTIMPVVLFSSNFDHVQKR